MEAPPSSFKLETIKVNCTRYRILVSTVALIRTERTSVKLRIGGEGAGEGGLRASKQGRLLSPWKFTRARASGMREEEEEEEGFSLGKRIFLTRGGILDRLELSRFVGHEEDVPRIGGTVWCVRACVWWDAFCATQV